MALRIYHWKHGWIPLDHTAALSKAHGSDTGAARILGRLHPVPQDHLPRQSHIIAGHGGDGHFTILDTKTNNTARIHDTLAHSLFANGHTITGVGEGGKLKTSGPRGESHTVDKVTPAPAALGGWQKISPEHALGPMERDPRNNLPLSPAARAQAAAKVSQAYRHTNGHTVVIEPSMSQAKTQAFLDSVEHVTKGLGDNAGKPVLFHVPSSDSMFKDGRTLGYVRKGHHAVFVSPKTANGEAEQPKGTDFNMPAHEHTTTTRYVLAHELGHVIDNHHDHTKGVKSNTQAKTSLDKQLFNEFKSQMSRYGASDPQEAYAEAFAQWHSGEHNAVADAYAARYGWSR